MSDTKLSALAQGTLCDFYYGERQGVSKRYNHLGFFNVRDYGALGNGSNNDTPPIQTAINDAINSGVGAVVFFPPGQYNVSSSPNVITGATGTTGNGASALTANGTSTSGIVLMGCGALSVLINFSKSWILDINYGSGPGATSGPISAIYNLSFASRYKFATAGSTWDDLINTEQCAGGIHASVGIGFPNLYNCNFELWNGIGVFSASQNIVLEGCNINGNYDGTHAPRSIGYLLNNGSIRDCKITACGFGVVICGSGGGVGDIAGLDVEVCGTGISIGYSPIGFLEPLVA